MNTPLVQKGFKIASSPAFQHSVLFLAGAIDSYQGWKESPSHTTGGRAATAALRGGQCISRVCRYRARAWHHIICWADYDVHCTAGTVLVNANPVSALVDLVLPEKYKISKTIHGGADEFAAIGESMCRFGIACVNSSDNNITE